MIDITSKNRGAAKKLVTMLGHDARTARNMTLAELQSAIVRAINSDLITLQGVQRALNIEPTPPKGREHDNGDNARDDDANDDGTNNGPESNSESHDNDSDNDSKENSDADNDDSKKDGDGEGQGDDADKDEQESNDEQEQEGEQEQDEQEEQEQEGEQQEEQEEEENNAPVEHPMLDRIMKYIKAGLNVALVGPAGTGKSFIARQVAEKLDRNFYVNGALMSKYDLIGFCDAHGTYHDTPAYNAFVNGGIHCFDELDASAPDAVVAFNGMTDDQPFYTFPNGQQAQHADYVAIACMNTWGNGATSSYVGRYKQDAASMDRFVRVFIDYDPRIENRIGTKPVVDRVRAVRKACEALAIQHVCSYRMIVKATLAFTQGVPKAAIDSDIIFSGLDESTVKQITAQMKAQGAN